MSNSKPWGNKKGYILTVFIYLLSYLFYRHIWGISLDSSPRDFYIQYIPREMLEGDFWQSIWYLHHQAPLLNFLVGGCYILFGENYSTILLELIYNGMSLGCALLLYGCMKSYRVDDKFSVTLTALYISWPTNLLYHNLLFYNTPTEFLILLALKLVILWAKSHNNLTITLFWVTISVLILLRATVNIFYVLMVLLPFILLKLKEKKKLTGLIYSSIFPITVSLILLVKPIIQSGLKYGETFFWSNISQKVSSELLAWEREQLKAADKLTNYEGIFLFSHEQTFKEYTNNIPNKRGISILEIATTQAGLVNSHATYYSIINREVYKKDAITILTHYPKTYLRSIQTALVHYFSPGTNDMMLPIGENYNKILPLITSFNKYLLLSDGKKMSPILLVTLPTLMIFAMMLLVHKWSEKQTILWYTICSIGYISILPIMISFGDFSRYRSDIDPLYIFILGILIQYIKESWTHILTSKDTLKSGG